MNEKNPKMQRNKKGAHPAKECAYIAVFVALVISAQLALSALPGVEVVTVLFVSYAYAFGWKRGMLSATAFALLRQIVFGVFPTVLILYLVYYNALSLLFGSLGKKGDKPVKKLVFVVVLACVCTLGFTLLDCVITPVFYGFSLASAKAYALATLPFCLPQILCVGITVGTLFVPLAKTFQMIKRAL